MSGGHEHRSCVAVVGMAGRFPGGGGVSDFWRRLKAGQDGLHRVAPEELAAAGMSGMAANPAYVPFVMRTEGLDLFDNDFFGYSPGQARSLDPQHRVFLEIAWEAFEDAGYDTAAFPGLVGVFGASSRNGFASRAEPSSSPSAGFQSALDVGQDFLATRVSYKLDLRGPSLSVQSACSSSLVAVHLAVQSLLNFDCDMALAGGVSVQPALEFGYFYQRDSILSPDGRCRAFDAGANGVVGGSGGAAVVLRRLADAIADGDNIQAVILGSAVNNDGARKVGYAAPAVQGQVDVITDALAVAGVDADSIGCVEAHGTGTVLGDAVELNALTQVFRSSGRRRACALGSVKTNIGHLDVAAGVAGLIKAVLSVREGVLPPSLNFEQPNPELLADDSPFRVNSELRPWVSDSPRRAGVSSLGMGGTNAHVVLEEPPGTRPGVGEKDAPAGSELFVLSARSEAALERVCAQLADHLAAHPELPLRDVALTLQVGRRRFAHRRCFVADGRESLLTQLRGPAPRFAASPAGGEARIVLSCDGDWSGRAPTVQALVQAEVAFAEAYAACAAAVQEAAGIDFAGAGASVLADDQTARAFADFAADYALGRALIAHGVQFEGLTGSGPGLLAAAALAEAVSLGAAVAWLARLLDPSAAEPPETFDVPAIPLLVSIEPAQSSAAFVHAAEALRRMCAPLEPREDLVLLATAAIGDAGCGRPRTAAGFRKVAPAVCREPGGKDALLWTVGLLWIEGATINWAREPAGARRVSLPAYPFERTSFGLGGPGDGPRSGAPEGRLADLPAGPLDAGLKTYLPSWRPLLRLPSWRRSPDVRRWLVVLDDVDLGADLVTLLRAEGREVATVSGASQFGLAGEAQYTLDLGDEDHWRRLFEGLGQSGGAPGVVIYCTGLAAPAAGLGDEACGGPFAFLRAALHAFPADPVRIIFAAAGLQAVEAADGLRPSLAPLLAFATAASQERQSLKATVLDLPVHGDDPIDREVFAAYAERILEEASHRSFEPLVAYRGGRRLAPAFEPVRLASDGDALRPGGVYLITGGYGALGLSLAERLGAACGARLVLLGRKGLPDRGDWDRVLQAGSDLRACNAIRRIVAMEAAGVELHLARADIQDVDAVRSAVEQAEARLGPLTGVFHLAADLSRPPAGALRKTSWQDLMDQFGPKVGGLRVIEALLGDRELELRVAFSSTSVFLGGPGLAAYAGANAWMEREAAAANAARPRGSADWRLIQWDGWQIAGLKPSPNTFDVEAGLTTLQQILGAPFEARIVAACGDLDQRYRTWVVGRPPTAETPPTPVAKATDKREGATELEQAILDIWTEVLGAAELGPDDDFLELGGDSLSALRVIEQLEEMFAIELSLAEFIGGASSVKGLAALVVTELASGVAEQVEEPVG